MTKEIPRAGHGKENWRSLAVTWWLFNRQPFLFGTGFLIAIVAASLMFDAPFVGGRDAKTFPAQVVGFVTSESSYGTEVEAAVDVDGRRSVVVGMRQENSRCRIGSTLQVSRIRYWWGTDYNTISGVCD